MFRSTTRSSHLAGATGNTFVFGTDHRRYGARSVRRTYRFMRNMGLSQSAARHIAWEMLFATSTYGPTFVAGAAVAA